MNPELALEMDNLTSTDCVTVSKYVKSVVPKGHVLNDNGVDVDHLGHVVYAQALAKQLERIKSPASIGLFARWGTGKSFLLKYVQSILMNSQKKRENPHENETSTSKCNSTMTALTLFTLALLGIAVASFATKDIIPIPVGITFLFVAFLVLQICFAKDNCDTVTKSKPWYRFCKVLCYAVLTQLPVRENESPLISTSVRTKYTLKREKSNTTETDGRNKNWKVCDDHEERTRKFIYVNYNAWQYAGCDTLWAGIVTTLAEKIEQEFGIYTTRIFRSLSLELIERPIFQTRQEVKYLIIQFVQKQDSKTVLKEKILKKTVLNNYDVESIKPAEEWEREQNRRLIDIENKDNCWMVKFNNSNQAKQAYEELQAYNDIKVSVVETPPKHGAAKSCSKKKRQRFRKHFKNHVRLGHILSMLGVILLALTSTVLFVLALLKNTDKKKNLNKLAESEESTIAETVLVFLPAGVTALYTMFRILLTFFNSYRRQMIKALQGAKKDLVNELGFMDKIKTEVQSMTDLIHTVELSYNIEYKVIITIDDLDRVPLSKVKSVLEAVNILLSDRDSPFICIIAIDSRIANDCFLRSEEDGEIPLSINGHEYLKKIINLPFCLPEVDESSKSCYVGGLIDEADLTKRNYDQIEAQQNPSRVCQPEDDDDEDAADSALIFHSKRKPINFEQFLFDCRDLMYKDKDLIRCLSGNPRNIKRIFNVISITASVITSMQERENLCFIQEDSTDESYDVEDNKKFAKDVLYWIVLTDQWPFRMSYILVVIEDADQRNEGGRTGHKLEENISLFDIYTKYICNDEKAKIDCDHEQLLRLDYDSDVLYNLLLSCEKFMTKRIAKELRKYSINLDGNLMKSISIRREKYDFVTRPKNEEKSEQEQISNKAKPVASSSDDVVDSASPSTSSGHQVRSPIPQSLIKSPRQRKAADLFIDNAILQ